MILCFSVSDRIAIVMKCKYYAKGKKTTLNRREKSEKKEILLKQVQNSINFAQTNSRRKKNIK